MAGLRAAQQLTTHGVSVALLEARDRIGGRVLSVSSPELAEPIELGAEFVHGKAEPTLAIARDAGVRLIDFDDVHFEKRGEKFERLEDAFEPLTRVMQRLRDDDADVSAATFVEHTDFDELTRARFRHLVEGFVAAPLAEVSIRSLASDAPSSAEDARQQLVEGGYGALARHLAAQAAAAGAQTMLGTRVEGIERSSGQLRVACAAHTLQATACVVTLPIGVLSAQGGARFGLDESSLRALNQLGMGHAARVNLLFDEDIWSRVVPPEANFLHHSGALFETFWWHRVGSRWLWTAWAGGPNAEKLSRLPASEITHAAVSALATLILLPAETVASQLRATYAHDFSNDPYSRGAYSFVRPGGMPARSMLSGLTGPVFLAGEGMDDQYPGTVAGALNSADAIVPRVLAFLKERG